jgi:alanine racemase
MTRPVRARIDLSALQHNLSLARQAAPDSRVMAVIKANAYGHGAVPVARALKQADAFAVASIDEALVLREAGVQRPLLLLQGVFSADELEAAANYDLQVAVHVREQIDWLEKSRISAPLHVWLKVDTGMHRLGVPADYMATALDRLEKLVERRGGSIRLMSHLACADVPDSPANDAQLSVFRSLPERGYERSLANSAALLTRPDMCFDWVRPGIMLYGASPFDANVDQPVDLKAVMNFESELIAVQTRRQGDTIGYGQAWKCPVDMRIGVVAAGYGDGYPRQAPAGMPVLVNGKIVPLVGRVSMDTLYVDLRSQPEAVAGDSVQLWGGCLSAAAVATRAGTISYELFCSVSPRVPREYVNG